MSKQEVLTRKIEALCAAIPELTGVLLASSDGVPVAHSIKNGLDPARLASMAVTTAKLGDRVGDTIEIGPFNQVSFRASESNLLVFSVGPKAVLAVVSPKEANVGLVNIEARSTAQEIQRLFGP